MRAPLMPIGWPSAIAPPLTLTFSGSTPSSRVETMPTAAKASLISTRSRSFGSMPSRAHALAIARDGCVCRVRVRPGDDAVRADLGERGQAQLGGLLRAHDDDRAGAVGDLRGRAGGDRAVLGEGRLELGQALGGRVGADALVVA